MKANILVVEDEFVVARNLEKKLQAMSYDVCGVISSGEKAVRVAEEKRPDLVLMDIMLQGSVDGIEAAQVIHDRLDIPVVYLTAYSGDEILERAKITEPFGYLIKPFEDRELHAVIEVALYKRKLERKLKESEERFRTVAEFTYDWELWMGSEGEILYTSPSCLRITGYPAEAFREDPDLMLRMAHPEDRGKVEHHIKNRIQSKGPGELEYRILHKDGTVRWIGHCCQPVHSTTGKYLGTRASNRDVTRRKNAENELIQAKKLEATAILAGGIAHDFNNLLTAMMGYVEMAIMDANLDPPTLEYLRKAKEACWSARNLVKKFIVFSGGEIVSRKIVSLGDILGQAAAAARSKEIQVKLDADPALKPVRGDPEQLRQVMEILLENGAEAMPQGGVLRVKARNVVVESDASRESAGVSPGPHVRIVVEDEGVGISPENLPKVFDPYYSTKNRGAQKGMGLGLTLAHSILGKHHGSIRLDSKPGKGTAATVHLPSAEEEFKVRGSGKAKV